ncbi:uncharacterized protein LOC132204302 [Neocloeon triangulifer]|uniref:uncharacterized protein LOC132204302 n=1 Tax=Neocloeon triangulifer TaxID=2078957 RepID=UPI00286F2EE6|nr:uncharacterized protein LOC132204302 [Neocloeon triangulifer]
MSGTTLNKSRTNYLSTGSSREPIWTQVSGDPSEDSNNTASHPPPRLTNSENETSNGNAAHDGEGINFNHIGINTATAAVFIAGEMAGSGVLALPRALVDSGWIGPVLLIVLCLVACYGGTRLGACWTLLEERYPETYPKHLRTRNPYACIAHRALGNWGSRIVSGSIQITLFGAGTVYLILASELLNDLTKYLLPFGPCSWVVILAAFLLPAMWLGSPKDFWGVAVGALLTTAFSCLLMFTQMVIDGLQLDYHKDTKPHSFSKFFMAYGTIVFSFGGASTFPTIQNDMVDRSKFPTSVSVGFFLILILYLPVAIGGMLIYGEAANPNIALTLGDSWLMDAANLLMACHLILAFLIVTNPVSQELEHIMNVPHEFGRQRLWLRSGLMLGMVFMAESIPQFGKILSLVGGSTVTLLTFVLPPLCYMKLCDQVGPWPQAPPISLHERVFMYEMICLGVLGGSVASYNALLSIFSPNSFSRPCYFNWW